MIPSFFRIQKLPLASSTNSLAAEAAAQGQGEGLVICAARQTAGKGRRGRTWESPEGNLYVSVLLRPNCSPQGAGHYSFAAAMAVYDALAALRGEAELQLKWPNDVLIDGKKVSGILLEAAPVTEGIVKWLVVGVGINVASCPEGAAYPTTCLAQEGGGEAGVDVVLDAFLQAFDRWRLTLSHDGFDPVRRAWLADAKQGPMTVKMPHGEVTGTFGGLDADGGLILRLADGSERVIQTGDVFFS